MSKGEDITTKYKIDISEFKKGIKEANQQIKFANAQFKAASAGMDNWQKSSTGLSSKLQQLNSILINENKKLSAYKQQLEAVEKASQENGNRAEKLKTKLVELANNGVKKNSEEYRKYQKALTEVEKEQLGNEEAANKLRITILNQQATVNKTEKEIKQYTNALDELENSGDKTEKAIEDMNDDLEDTENAANKAENGFTVMKAALADLIANGIRKGIDAFKDLVKESITASNKLQASIGATDEEMSQFNKEMQNIYNNNYGENLQDIGDKMAYVKQVTGEVDPSKIGKLTENAIALEDTFDSDFNETIRGVSNLMNHFGIDSELAFNLFAKGSQLGLDYTSELGDNIAEYGGNFQQAGYSAEEYFQLLLNGSKGGAYNLDKVNDSINEVKNRLGDGTIEKNLNIFSKGTQQTFKEWKNGHGTMKDVIDSIIGDISNCSNEQKKLTMAATAFGTMGEDANLKVVQSLTTVGDNFKDVKGTMESVKDVRYDDIGSSLSELGRTLKSELLQPIVDTIAPLIKDLVKWILDNLPAVVPIVTGLATAFGILATALAIQGLVNGVAKAMTFLNTTLLANPIVLIVAAIAGLVVAFISLWNKSEEFRNFWIGLWEGIKNVVQTVWEAIVGFFSNAWEKIKSVWGGVTGFFTRVWEGIKNILTPVAKWFYDVVIAPIWQKVQFIVGIFTSAWTLISQLAKGCWNLIKVVWSVVSDWFNTKIAQPVKNIFTAMWNGIKIAAQIAWNFIKRIWSTVSTWFNTKIVRPVKNTFTVMWNALKTGASNAWNGIKNIFSKVTSFFKSTFEKAWNAVKNVFSTGGKIFVGIKDGIVNAFKSVVNAIIDGINKVVKLPFEGLNNTLNKLQNIEVAGVKPFNGLTWRATIPQIPKLYRGGILKKGQTGYLEGNGAEAVVPLERNKYWIKKVANELLKYFDITSIESNLKGSIEELKIALLQLSSGFGISKTALVSTNGITTQSTNNNFTQIINSPKALSRIEIYRQTKNLLALKGG